MPNRSRSRFVFVFSLLSLPAFSAAGADRPSRVWQPVNHADIDASLRRDEGEAIVVAPVGGAEVKLAVRSLGVEDLRYLKNVRAAGTFRDWHFSKWPEGMTDGPPVIRGAFVRVVCEDLKFSEAVIELIRDDYRRRCYPLKALSDEDRAAALALQKESDARLPHAAHPPYLTRYKEYQPDKGHIHFAETEHFLFQWGSDENASGKALFQDAHFVAQNQYWFEKVWDFFDRQMHAPMPMADSADKHKICVYITGTGLPRHKEGFAFGSEAIIIHPAAMGYGSSVVPHEFTHSIQFYSGGFRDNPLVGWFWECHANWSAHQFMPASPNALEVYFERQHYELNSSRMNYGSWPFLQYMGEHPSIGTGFCYDIWRQNRRDAQGHSVEDPLQTIMRVGAERGYFAGNGVQGFGDILGQTAAHDVTWDYTAKFFYQRLWRGMLKHAPTVSRTRTLLEPTPDRPGFYSPIFSHAPRQFGVNMIDLVREPGSSTVEVDFQGLVDETEGSDWRTTLVAIDAQGEARYSRMTHGGRLAMTLKPTEQKLTLAVAATPTVYKPQDFRPGYGKKPRFPYEVSFKGCHPADAPPQAESRAPASDCKPHPNGGGLVAKSAKVAATAYVGPSARVLEGAKVLDSARIEGHAIISGRATVSGSAQVTGWATVTDRAIVGDEARVRDCVVIRGEASVGENARVIEYAVLQGKGSVKGHALVKGWGEIDLDAKSPIGGGTICGEDMEVHLVNRDEPIQGGLIYGFSDRGILAKDLHDNHFLYAHWDFTQPRRNVLKDAFADCQGILRGAPAFVTDGNRAALSLNGRDQYALLERHIVDADAITFDFQMKWTGSSPGQSVFEFGSPGASLGFTPLDASGKAAFVISKGAARQALAAPRPCPKNRWVHITISVGNGVGRLFLDDQLVAENKEMTLRPEDVNATCGYLGRRVSGSGYFSGTLCDFAVYRRAVASPTDLKQP